MNPRVAAAKIIAAVLRQQGSLSSQLPPILAKLPVTERPLVQNLCYGSLRWYPRLNAYLELLLDKPLRSKDSDISALMLLGLYQLEYTRIPDHAAIGETAGAARALKKAWGTGLVNAILRRFVREKTLLDEQLANNPEFCSAHPQWLLDALTSAWPESAAGIIEAN
ncbi:MAG TPA: transcription antitermination factor NusB, partial [Marinobacter sp.]|nr:transcription antitermination factor NusB [Marinobacter sp.]